MDVTFIFFLAFLFLLLPIVAIVLYFLFRGEEDKEKEEQKQERDQKSDHPSGLQQVARLWHDPLRGELAVEIDGQIFRSVAEINLDQYRRLAGTFDELRDWLNASPDVNLPERSVSVESQQVGALPELLEQVEGAAEVAQPADVSPPPVQQLRVSAYSPIEESDEAARSVINPLSVFARVLQPLPEVETPSLNVVAQINAILQENMEGTPLKQRGILLMEQSDHSMVVMVGLDKFNNVDEVPDEQVRMAIRQAVSQWEDR
jgi:hypothetical protein